MRTRLEYFITLWAILLISCSSIRAGEITQKIQNRYQEISSFRTNFTQKLTKAASGNTEVRKGKIVFKKPALVRWKTEKPEEKLLLVTNSTVWQYIPAEKVAYKYSLRGKFKSKTMIEFITGEVNIEEDFQVKKKGKSQQGWLKLKLIPKDPEPGMVMAHIWVEPQSGILRKIKIRDFCSNKNTLRFEHIQLRPEISKGVFTFDPSEGIKVKDNTRK